MIKTYSELIKINNFSERFEYLILGGKVGADTFGFDRYLNQIFYRTKEWLDVRDYVIIRDHGCDLGMDGYEIYGNIIIHHMNPIDPELLKSHDMSVLDPEFLISCSLKTHNAVHYGDKSYLETITINERTPFDTCPWKK